MWEGEYELLNRKFWIKYIYQACRSSQKVLAVLKDWMAEVRENKKTVEKWDANTTSTITAAVKHVALSIMRLKRTKCSMWTKHVITFLNEI